VCGELAAHTMQGEFRNINSEDARILLVEGGPRILSMYVPKLSTYGVSALEDLGVAVLTNTSVTHIDATGVEVESATGKEHIPAKTVLWAAGVQASPLAKMLVDGAGAVADRAGRILVNPDLTVGAHKDILVLGDLAHFAHTPDKVPLPGVATVAMQMGKHAAVVIARRIDKDGGKDQNTDGPAFRFFDKGTMAVIGRNKAVARIGVVNWSFPGFIAWLAWLFIHIVFLVGFENRLLVLVQWANHYITRHRGSRLITARRRA
jgi:NADH:ubiquinone reductase (H+-translocating)